MTIGFIGLGRMGKNMVLNLLEHRIPVVAYNREPDAVKDVAHYGARPAFFLEELVTLLPKQKIIWLMITAGKPVDTVIQQLLPQLRPGDIVIDGGNSLYTDSQRRANALKKKGITFLDVGTSGGISGARHGACMMVGGDKQAYKKTEFLYKVMCVKGGYEYMGRSGAGHFVKMVHNGIEYGMMGAIAEGLQAIGQHSKSLGMDLNRVAQVYAHGSIIESRLMSWASSGLKRSDLKQISGSVPPGETEAEMRHLEKIARMPILRKARECRVESRTKPTFAGKLIALMRNEFGGHLLN
ncbi:decarboxylating 6-phosphogluconate dehydrogenase [Candidatus Uhrbacteria bacterium]|nr:decarboxylating 6-phosphogluconate dehydrogenase [Candidatus Uhrbacteria bacterium]